MKQHLIETFRYNDWANRQTLEMIQRMPRPEGAVRLFSHIITSQDKWMARIRKDESETRLGWFAGPIPLEKLASKWSASLATWLVFLEAAPDESLDQVVDFVSTEGKAHSVKLREIALQLNYHSIHHRAQIGLLAREQGLNPPFIDYMGYVFTRNQ
jgi:uncharacterized damage-inducible protein DinB